MIPVGQCLICGAGRLVRVPSRIAPFIVERCRLAAPLPAVTLAWCPACDFSFFDHRFDDEEALLLYRDYRDDHYNRQRLAREPYYHVVRELIEDQREDYRATRIRNLQALFGDAPNPRGKVLDYGGERDGWLAKGACPESRVQVFDLSFATARPAPCSQDLVICSNVFEHVSFPMALLAELNGFLGPGGNLCVEVPMERPGALVEPGAGAANPLHEHISFFSPRAVLKMLLLGGFQPLDGGRIHGDLYGVVARMAEFPGSRTGLPDPLPEAPQAVEPSAPEAERSPFLTPAVIQKVNALAQGWREQGLSLVLAPAGRFTRSLLEHTQLRAANLIALCDRDPSLTGGKAPGLPVHAYEDVPALNPDILLVASPEHETEILSALALRFGESRKVLALAGLLWP